MNGKSNWIKQKIRNDVSKKSRGVCFYCETKASRAEINKRGILVFYDKQNRVYHIDHKSPLSEGGSNESENLVLSCQDCNLSKRKKRMANDPVVLKLLKEINK